MLLFSRVERHDACVMSCEHVGRVRRGQLEMSAPSVRIEFRHQRSCHVLVRGRQIRYRLAG